MAVARTEGLIGIGECQRAVCILLLKFLVVTIEIYKSLSRSAGSVWFFLVRNLLLSRYSPWHNFKCRGRNLPYAAADYATIIIDGTARFHTRSNPDRSPAFAAISNGHHRLIWPTGWWFERALMWENAFLLWNIAALIVTTVYKCFIFASFNVIFAFQKMRLKWHPVNQIIDKKK